VVRWHVRVRGDAARVRRDDHSRARVFALLARSKACAPHIEAIQAPRVAASLPVLRFGGDAVAPGLELWLSEGAALAEVRVESIEDPLRSVRVALSNGPGPSAYDPAGVLWARVARVALPNWAARGVRVRGGAGAAVRALVRMPRDRGPASS